MKMSIKLLSNRRNMFLLLIMLETELFEIDERYQIPV